MTLARRSFVVPSAAVALVCALSAEPAAAAPATFVSTFGRDTAPCTRNRPCRTFNAALAVTDPGGTVLALDSGVFTFAHLDVRGSVTIAAAPGERAELRPASGAAVSVNAGLSDTVVLRGLTMVYPAGGALPFNGIIYNQAAALYVEDCEIVGFPTKGMLVLSRGRLVVRHSTVRNGVVGISLDGHVRAAFDDVTITDAEFGLMSSLGATATIRDSLISGNGVGLLADALFEDHTAELSVENCAITHNTTGLEVRAGRTIARLSRSTVTNNATGVLVSGILETRGNNTIRGNGTDVSGPLTPIAGD